MKNNPTNTTKNTTKREEQKKMYHVTRVTIVDKLTPFFVYDRFVVMDKKNVPVPGGLFPRTPEGRAQADRFIRDQTSLDHMTVNKAERKRTTKRIDPKVNKENHDRYLSVWTESGRAETGPVGDLDLCFENGRPLMIETETDCFWSTFFTPPKDRKKVKRPDRFYVEETVAEMGRRTRLQYAVIDGQTGDPVVNGTFPRNKYGLQLAQETANKLNTRPVETETPEVEKDPDPFGTMLKAFDKDDPETVQTAGTALGCAVLKKIYNASANPQIRQYRTDLIRDDRRLKAQYKAGDLAHYNTFNKNGDPVVKVDQKWEQIVVTNVTRPLGDGLDRAHDAVVALLEEVEKAEQRDPGHKIDLTAEYTVRRLHRKVWLKEEGSSAFVEEETTPVSEVYREVRRKIDDAGSVKTAPQNMFSYIEGETVDPVTGEKFRMYYRTKKCADLGGTGQYRSDLDLHAIPGGPEGMVTSGASYTTGADTFEQINNIVERLKLSEQQRVILDLRLSGLATAGREHGRRSIATYLGVRDDNVKVQLKRIKAKAVKIGFDPVTIHEQDRPVTAFDPVAVYAHWTTPTGEERTTDPAKK